METSALSFLTLPADTDFTMHNLPFGVFHTKTETQANARCASRLGDFIVDLSMLFASGLLSLKSTTQNVFAKDNLNEFISLDNSEWNWVRSQLKSLLAPKSELACKEYMGKFIFNESQCVVLLPVTVGDYTDFYSSRNHAINVGTMFRGPENALKPNWTWLPVGYHGRASSVVVSPAQFTRPSGQMKARNETVPTYGKSKKMDFELEMVTVIGRNNKLGEPVPIDQAGDHIFGYLLMNDVSVRDVQGWEYIPLGPFTGKNCITVVSPWIVTAEALKPFRKELPAQDPAPLAYLAEKEHASYDLPLQVLIETKQTTKPQLLATSNMKYLYWSPEQQLAHHTVTGCNLRVGDMLGSGTISGTQKSEYGSFLELSWNGKQQIAIEETKESRTFWEDGDTILMKGTAQKEGVRVGFGECRTKLLP